jgi:hypothetical protein
MVLAHHPHRRAACEDERFRHSLPWTSKGVLTRQGRPEAWSLPAYSWLEMAGRGCTWLADCPQLGPHSGVAWNPVNIRRGWDETGSSSSTLPYAATVTGTGTARAGGAE